MTVAEIDPRVSDYARSLVGQDLTYQGPRGGSTRGKVTGVRRAQCRIITDEGSFPGVQFRIRGRWSVAFADTGRPPEGDA